jgi:predicted DNA-binding transcriptional regulator YafY
MAGGRAKCQCRLGKSWVLGFGANAVVIEPEDLRQAIARELEQLVKVYQKQPLTT